MAGISTQVEIVDKVSGSLNRITASLYNTTSAFNAVDRASDVAFNPSGVQAMANELYDYSQRIGQLESDLVSANRKIEQMEEQTKKAAQSAEMLKKAFSAVKGIITGMAVKKIIETSDSLVQTTSRINMMNDGLQTTDELMNMVYRSAQNARGSMSDMADVVARFGNNVGIGENKVFKSSEEVVAFAELLQKQMTIAGASTSEASAAMLQLSQGLGSGTLRGDELNSIFEQAPNLIRNIATYIERNEEVAQHMADVVKVSYEEMSTNAMGHIRDLAAEGQISADIVKNAIFSATTDINSQFDSMPMTWGQVWQSMQNTAIMSFKPVLNEINKLASDGTFQRVVGGITSAMSTVATVALKVGKAVANVAGFIADNWSIIAPVVAGVVSIMAVYWTVTKGITIAQTAYNAVVGAFHALQTFVSIGWGVLTGNTAAASAAQFTYNSALLACPLTWFLMAIIAIIAVIYIVVGLINKFAKTSVSATGIIAGVFFALGAGIWNTVTGVLNAIIQFLWTSFVEPWIGIIEWVLNIMNGGFNSFGDAAMNLLGQIISWALSLVKVVAKISDAIFGTDWVSGLEELQNEVTSWGKNEDAISLSREAPISISRIEYGEAYNKGYAIGEELDAKINDLFSSDDDVFKEDEYTALLNDIDFNTSEIADNIDISNENLKYLRDMAEQEVVNRFTTAEIKVDMTNNNNINNSMDIDGIVEQLTLGVQEAMTVAAEGV